MSANVFKVDGVWHGCLIVARKRSCDIGLKHERSIKYIYALMAQVLQRAN